MKNLGKLGVGPVSTEIVEAVFSYSHEHQKPMMLIASKNQIDWDGGYVNNWTTKQYAQFVNQLRQKYSKAQVYICRDHCGPDFKNSDLNDVYKTIDSDLENNFDLIHIDFCHMEKREEVLRESKKAIDYILKKNPATLVEVGTEENKGDFLYDVSAVEDEMKFFSEIAPIHFFVVQTGSLVKEIGQVGRFNRLFIEKVRRIADKYNFNLKEHNSDYLTQEEIAERKKLIEAVNIAPQLGVIQTQLTLEKCRAYGIDPSEFLDAAYKSGKWRKWLYINTSDNKFLCSMIAGHYVFSSDAYKNIYDKINKHEDFRKSIVLEMMKNFKIYLDNLI